MALYCCYVVWGFYRLVWGRRISRFLFQAGSGLGDIDYQWYYASWFCRCKSAPSNPFY